jgi:hypothetical protein
MSQQPPPDVVLAALTRAITSRTAWDEEPEWGFLRWQPGAEVQVRPIPTPNAAWVAAGNPVNVLRHMVALLRHPANDHESTLANSIRRYRPGDLCGIYMRVEAYGPPPHMYQEIHRRHEAGGSIGLFKDLPGHIESRDIHAVDTANRAYAARQQRGTQRVTTLYDDPERGQAVLGNMVELLKALLVENRKPPTPDVPALFTNRV